MALGVGSPLQDSRQHHTATDGSELHKTDSQRKHTTGLAGWEVHLVAHLCSQEHVEYLAPDAGLQLRQQAFPSQGILDSCVRGDAAGRAAP